MRTWPRRRLIALAAVACLTAIAVAYGVCVLAGGGSKPRLRLDSKPGGTVDPDGAWRVTRGSIVGYRVREKLQSDRA